MLQFTTNICGMRILQKHLICVPSIIFNYKESKRVYVILRNVTKYMFYIQENIICDDIIIYLIYLASWEKIKINY